MGLGLGGRTAYWSDISAEMTDVPAKKSFHFKRLLLWPCWFLVCHLMINLPLQLYTVTIYNCTIRCLLEEEGLSLGSVFFFHKVFSSWCLREFYFASLALACSLGIEIFIWVSVKQLCDNREWNWTWSSFNFFSWLNSSLKSSTCWL